MPHLPRKFKIFARRFKALHTLEMRLNAEREAARIFKNKAIPPIFVYQMGKVGSSAVYQSLKAAKIANPIIHLHFLSKDLPLIRKRCENAGLIPAPSHIFLGEAVRRQILRKPNHQYKIISLVRDPIARVVSDLYQNPHFISENNLQSDNSNLIDSNRAVEYLEKKFSDQDAFKYIYEWFDKELKSVFDIDVFKEPFPVDLGYATYRKANAEALVVRLEDLSTVGSSAISEFLNLDRPIEIKHSNVRRESISGNSYLQTTQKLKISLPICQEIYSSPFVRHFYSKSMIDHFIRKWSEGIE